MNRRRFFEMMGWAVAAPVAYSFIGSGLWTPPAMIIAPFGSYPGLTVAEWHKRALNRRRGVVTIHSGVGARESYLTAIGL